MRFRPALVHDHPVAELVQLTLAFGPRIPTITVGRPDESAAVSFNKDTAWLVLTTSRGQFTVHADSFTTAAWADSAAHVHAPTPHGSYPEASLSTIVAMGILRLSADSASPFQISAANGSWSGALSVPYDSAQRLFAAMRGSPSTLTVSKEGWITSGPFIPGHMEIQAKPRPGNSTPRYPESLRLKQVEGTVVMQFVVDSAGNVDMSSARLLRSSHPLLALAVYQALPRMRYFPASVDGKSVKELVQQPFAFNISHAMFR